MFLKILFRINFQPILITVISGIFCLAEVYGVQSAELNATTSLNKQAICNSNFFVFNLGDGPNLVVKAKQGKFKSASAEGSISDAFFAQGKLEGQPAAVAFVVWSTGGSGCFEELALFRLRNHKVCCTGIYSLEDRATINKLSIQNNEVVLDWLKHADNDLAPSPSKHEVLHLKSREFEKCGP